MKVAEVCPLQWPSVWKKLFVLSTNWHSLKRRESRISSLKEINERRVLKVRTGTPTERPNYKPNQSANFKKKGKPSGQGSQNNQPQRKNPQNYPMYKKCGRTHQRECQAGNPNVCYQCGKEGHYVRHCPNFANYKNVPAPNKNPAPKAYVMQATLEGPSISQGRLEAPELEAKIYAYTKGDIEAGTSNVVTGQLSVANLTLHVLFDSGATYSFISTVHAN